MTSLDIRTCSESSNDCDLMPDDPTLDYLAPDVAREAIFERQPSGAAARKKLEGAIGKTLSVAFYFYRGELIGDPNKEALPMKLTGCEFRPATKGSKKGRWIVPVPGTERSVVVTPEDVSAFEAAQESTRAAERP
ncbi:MULTISPECIES: hypothetical protein [Achromobacter]|uniref:Uncharacterized protein n=1 Tax=Achromobacter xylosoxidans (strain A8) TaxID=762376 RepID=E3HYA8_ACHXA|nr:hypothetical protein [Achromobacter xylosoxidans]ADP20062.1 hypothetical protein AXYL_06780 [Achromobacter xylosoxidans A8]